MTGITNPLKIDCMMFPNLLQALQLALKLSHLLGGKHRYRNYLLVYCKYDKNTTYC